MFDLWEIDSARVDEPVAPARLQTRLRTTALHVAMLDVSYPCHFRGIHLLKSLLAFWGELLRDPRCIGSIAPSGKSLGMAIAREVMADNPGFVIELGAGTGTITRALLDIRHELADLLVIEKSPRLAALLSQRYPVLDVRAGCASLLDELHTPGAQALTIVSSLPLRSLPPTELAAIQNTIDILDSRHADFRFIQYSYFGRIPFVSHMPHLSWERKKTVVANLPPATIWVLRNNTARHEGASSG